MAVGTLTGRATFRRFGVERLLCAPVPFGFDLRRDLLQRQIAKPLIAFIRVVTRTAAELIQESQRIGYAHFASENRRGLLIDFR